MECNHDASRGSRPAGTPAVDRCAALTLDRLALVVARAGTVQLTAGSVIGGAGGFGDQLGEQMGDLIWRP
jgi:hypothetical protein